MNYPLPRRNYLDIKITYACNFKCEYCYQVDQNGFRQKGVMKKETVENLINFVKRLDDKFYVTLAGGEPFVFPHLDYLASSLVKLGHKVNIISNFSQPFEKIERFVRLTGSGLNSFAISVHISQWRSIEEFYNKLKLLIDLKEKENYSFVIELTCVVTEENFELVKKLYDLNKERIGLSLELQRYYDHAGKYKIYRQEIEQYLQKRGIDIPTDDANNKFFTGIPCWAGSKFFYIEYDGNVQRCYTKQADSTKFILGNLSNWEAIPINKNPTQCESLDGRCICYKHFVRQGIALEEYREENTLFGKVRRYFRILNRNRQAKEYF